MNGQAPGPGFPNDALYLTRVTLFITLLCMGYNLSRPKPDSNKEHLSFLPETGRSVSPEQDRTGLPPWQKKASEKAVERYAGSQEKKWQRWNEAMFERSG